MATQTTSLFTLLQQTPRFIGCDQQREMQICGVEMYSNNFPDKGKQLSQLFKELPSLKFDRRSASYHVHGGKSRTSFISLCCWVTKTLGNLGLEY